MDSFYAQFFCNFKTNSTVWMRFYSGKNKYLCLLSFLSTKYNSKQIIKPFIQCRIKD